MKLTDEWTYDANRQREFYRLLARFKWGTTEMRAVLSAVDQLVNNAYEAGKRDGIAVVSPRRSPSDMEI